MIVTLANGRVVKSSFFVCVNNSNKNITGTYAIVIQALSFILITME
jgi:hypothetical protein